MSKLIELEIEGYEYTLPDPCIVSEAVLRASLIRDKSGALLFYSFTDKAGGIFLPKMSDSPPWLIYLPISVDEFKRGAAEFIARYRHIKPTAEMLN